MSSLRNRVYSIWLNTSHSWKMNEYQRKISSKYRKNITFPSLLWRQFSSIKILQYVNIFSFFSQRVNILSCSENRYVTQDPLSLFQYFSFSLITSRLGRLWCHVTRTTIFLELFYFFPWNPYETPQLHGLYIIRCSQKFQDLCPLFCHLFKKC